MFRKAQTVRLVRRAFVNDNSFQTDALHAETCRTQLAMLRPDHVGSLNQNKLMGENLQSTELTSDSEPAKTRQAARASAVPSHMN